MHSTPPNNHRMPKALDTAKCSKLWRLKKLESGNRPRRFGDSADSLIARIGPLRSEVLHAGHDGHDPQSGAQRSLAGRGPRPKQSAVTAVSPTTPTGVLSRCTPMWFSGFSKRHVRRVARSRPSDERNVSLDTELTDVDLESSSPGPVQGQTVKRSPRESRSRRMRATPIVGRHGRRVFSSWENPRAQRYRRAVRNPRFDLGTAVNVFSAWSSATCW